MAYAPTVQYVRSGERDYNPPALNLKLEQDQDNIANSVRDVAALMDKRYKESTDFYDVQKQESDNLNKMLDDLDGKDYETMMQEIVKTRDEFAKIFKGKKLKDYNTPEFQKLLFEKKKSLSDIRNGIATGKNQANAAVQFMKTAPHAKQGPMRDRINEYLSMSPAERTKVNLVDEFATDPLYFNPVDYATSFLNKLGKSTIPVSRDTKDALIVTQREFLPAIYTVDGSGKEAMTISDETIKSMFDEDPRFRAAMENMAFDTDKALLMQEHGHSSFKDEDVVQFTKDYLSGVESLKSREVGKPAVRYKAVNRPTATQTKEADRAAEAADIQKRLLSGDDNPFFEYISTGDSGFDGFEVVKDDDGRIVQIVPSIKHKTKSGRIKTEKGDVININPNDINDVKRVVEFIRVNAGKDRNVEGAPSKAPKTMSLAEKMRSLKK